ncbi:MAG: nitrogen fixation protein NifU [Firmicutes bacterium]|nr:nitrogen fixation protein NifU [Bacillota bacterium]
MEEKIREVLETKVKPQLSEHDGGIEFIGYKDGIVEVRLLGQCSGCPSAKFTVENTVEAVLKEEIPGIRGVELSACISRETLDFAKRILNKEI